MQKWPFGDLSGSSEIALVLMGNKKGKKIKCNKKTIKKKIKDRNYKCDKQTDTNTCQCNEFKTRSVTAQLTSPRFWLRVASPM